MLRTSVGADGVAELVIDRPERRNALTGAMWAELPKLLAELAGHARVLVVRGQGGHFSAGADIEELREVYADPDAAAEYHSVNVRAEEALAAFPRPTLAVVQGACVGGGCQLAAACDLRIAAPDARFGVTPARMGIVYPASSTLRLSRLLGPARAKYLLFSGELVTAAQALAFGLVEEVTPGAPERGRELARTLARRSGQTQGAAKAVIDGGADAVGPWLALAREAPHAREGLAAFLERREPEFPL
ncbi:enoyl-CoA hydratase/isomerase family protein [Streptacidiphilus monticola]|uniref:Enoyl-CoA hydratase/isomerase family protein n=1 Tax=Streptacidiphilus monticola TaxID=2161674 RepID=A0ABW1G9J1_9ACTN